MAIASVCIKQITEYKFLVWDTTTAQAYSDAGIDMTTGVTAAVLEFSDFDLFTLIPPVLAIVLTRH